MFLAATALTILIGAAHSYLGERYLLVRLFRREDLPRLAGSSEFTKQTLRLAWHITTVLAFGFAALLYVLATTDGITSSAAATITAVTIGACGVVSLVFSRGRHLSWIVFFAIAALTWLGGR